jgi:Ca2+-binding RTX toxin-like protein
MKRGFSAVVAAAACSALVFATVALAETIKGTQGDDPALNGTPNADKILGKKGNDTISGLAGDDRIWAGPGNDTVYGGSAAAATGTGNDSLSGKAGTDTLNGQDGNDFLAGGGQVDTLNGGDGDDWLKGRGDGNAADQITCGLGNDTVKADKNDVITDGTNCENVDRSGDGNATKPPKPPHPTKP